jgi:hypothetical protein
MKTIIDTQNNWSKYIFEDDISLSIEADRIVTPDFIIGDLNSNNASIIENVTPPSDWTGCKYIYADSTWTLNSEWTDPED